MKDLKFYLSEKYINYEDEKRFDDDIVKAIDDYQGWSSTLNKSLFNKKLSKDEKEIVNKIDDAFKKTSNKTNKDTLYRGISNKRFNELVEKGELKYDAYLSTSLDKSIANRFNDKHENLLVITPSKSYPFIYLSPDDKFRDEKEVLLPRGLKLKVDKVVDNIIYATV